jgi:hypothetical protein
MLGYIYKLAGRAGTAVAHNIRALQTPLHEVTVGEV